MHAYLKSDVYDELPQKAKDYIMELETRCDPAGDVAELANRREQVAQLERRVLVYRDALTDIRVVLTDLLNGKITDWPFREKEIRDWLDARNRD